MRTRLLAVLLLGVAAIVGCGDDDNNNDPNHDAGHDAGLVPGVCDLSKCPAPINGVACCTPDARCGSDPGFGACIPGGQPPANICELDECAVPPTGVACCLSNGKCGRDPWELGVCFPNPPRQNEDAGGPTCDLSECPSPDEGIACCMPSGRCGIDLLGLGFCALPMEDAGVTDPTEPPDDPTITGECPSYLGAGNLPVWGCCSRFGVCGTFAYDMCLLAPGTQIPVPANDGVDAGISGLCTPPTVE